MSDIEEILKSADSYKLSHKVQIFPGTTTLYETFTPRSNKHAPRELVELVGDNVIWFGAQATMRMIHEAFQREFFDVPFEVAMKPFRDQVGFFAGADYDDSHFKALHDLGYLPLKVKSIPEGTLLPIRHAGMTLKNTKGKLIDSVWLVGFLETVISNETWKSVTNATMAFGYRRLLQQAAIETVGNADFVKWQGHDFSARGLSSSGDAQRQGMSHMTSFLGSDSFGATSMVAKNYDVASDSFIAGSINASEHMTETLAIQVLARLNGVSLEEAEYLQMKRLITEVFPSGLVARVCDSYDYWNVVTNIVPRLKDEIMARKPDALGMAKVVIRPDSGDPVKIICGTAIPVNTMTDVERYFRKNVAQDGSVITGGAIFVKTVRQLDGAFDASYMLCHNSSSGISTSIIPAELVTPEMKGTVECLWETFGGTITEKGYRLLDSHIGMIYGDSITIKRAKEIVTRLKAKGFASINTVLGIGSYTYQYVTRDTFGMALKATFAVVDGIEIDLNKDPKTDDGTKKSAKGRVRVEKSMGSFVMYDQQSEEQEELGELKTIYEDGKFYNQVTFDQVRALIDSQV